VLFTHNSPATPYGPREASPSFAFKIYFTLPVELAMCSGFPAAGSRVFCLISVRPFSFFFFLILVSRFPCAPPRPRLPQACRSPCTPYETFVEKKTRRTVRKRAEHRQVF